MKNIHTERYKAFLRRLRDARLAAGKTQSAVAQALGKPQSFVSKIERGERRLDPLELKELADLYGVRVESLLRSEAERGPSSGRKTKRPRFRGMP